MERIYGKHPDELNNQEVAQLLSEKTINQLKEKTLKMIRAGYYMGDFQFLILTKDQIINGVLHKKGDIIFIDAGSLAKGKYDEKTEIFTTEDGYKRNIKETIDREYDVINDIIEKYKRTSVEEMAVASITSQVINEFKRNIAQT